MSDESQLRADREGVEAGTNRLVARMNEVLSSLQLSLEPFAERREDGLVEVHGLGHPLVADDDDSVEWLIRLSELDGDLHPDDLLDAVVAAFPSELD